MKNSWKKQYNLKRIINRSFKYLNYTMNNLYNSFRKIVKRIIIIVMIFSAVFFILGFLFLFRKHDGINVEKSITGIIIPMLCAIIGACIPIAMDNSLSNEKFKISLDRLKFHRQNFCKDKDGNNVDGSNSRGFDTEFKFIYKNRGKNYDELLDLMKDDYYREEKYLNEISDKKITKNRFLKDWIEDHFIY